MLALRIFFLNLMDFGVTSTNSSSRMNSIACSRFSSLGGTRRMASSADEEIVNFVQYFLRACIGAVDFVDDEDRRQFCLQRFHQNVAGLRQRAFAGIDQQHDSIDNF